MYIDLDMSQDSDIMEDCEGWESSLTVYANQGEARADGSILGCKWECPRDMAYGYAIVMFGAAGPYTDARWDVAIARLMTELSEAGYRIDRPDVRAILPFASAEHGRISA